MDRHGDASRVLTASLDAVEDGDGDRERDGEDGEEGRGEEELDEALLRCAGGTTTMSSSSLLLHSSSSCGSTRRVTSFPVRTPAGQNEFMTFLDITR